MTTKLFYSGHRVGHRLRADDLASLGESRRRIRRARRRLPEGPAWHGRGHDGDDDAWRRRPPHPSPLEKHEKEIGLSAEQVTKLKDLQLNLDKNRIKMEADIQVAEREVKALTDDEKSDIRAIEAKLKQSAEVQIGLRVLSVKTRRDALALTPEQRAKEQAEHEDDAAAQGRGRTARKNPMAATRMARIPTVPIRMARRNLNKPFTCIESEVLDDEAPGSSGSDGRGTVPDDDSCVE